LNRQILSRSARRATYALWAGTLTPHLPTERFGTSHRAKNPLLRHCAGSLNDRQSQTACVHRSRPDRGLCRFSLYLRAPNGARRLAVSGLRFEGRSTDVCRLLINFQTVPLGTLVGGVCEVD
jgi:hypothetical protein